MKKYKLTLGFSDEDIEELRIAAFNKLHNEAQTLTNDIRLIYREGRIRSNHLVTFDDITELKEAANRLSNLIAKSEALLSGDFNQDYKGDE